MKGYKHIFFDLDRTLWDFDTNSRQALEELYAASDLEGRAPFDAFLKVYQETNEMLWRAYRMGNVTKRSLRSLRFAKTLEHFGIRDAQLSERMGQAYIELSPKKTALLPNTIETLDYLSSRYKLHIITNGFEEVQHIKMEHSGLRPYFTEVITSERAAAKKPSPEVFLLAFHLAKATAPESLMVGDDLEADMAGARAVWMDHVYFNPDRRPHSEPVTHEISDLGELRNLL
jgi:putative hydrolase of the HAD superfamily